MSLNRWALAAALHGALLSSVSVVHADRDARGSQGSASSGDRVVALFEKSKLAFRAGQFEESAKLLLAAYAIRPEPVFLYNLGRAYEGLDRREDAVSAYKRYLTEAPDVLDRGAIEKSITTLERQIEERRNAEREAQKPRSVEKPLPPPKPPSVGPWIAGGVGVGIAGAGVVFGLLANAKHASAVDNADGVAAESQQSDAKTFATVANVSFVAGAVVVAAGVTWLILDRASSRTSTSALPTIVGVTF